MTRYFLLLLALMLTPGLAAAQGITPELVAEGAAPAGGEVELAIHMRPAPGWHGYWLNPGDAGLPMNVVWQLPKGFSAGPLRYPVPSRLGISGLMNYVFEGDYAVLVRLKVPKDAHGSVPVRASAHWLACTDRICVPENGDLSIDVPVGSETPNRARFDAWRQALPRPLATVGHFQVAGGRMTVAIPLPASVAVDQPYLFPMTDNVVDYDAPQQFRRSGDWLIAELHANRAPGQLDGVVAYGSGRGLQFHAVPGAVPAGGTGLDAPRWRAILWALLGAIAGGILLNLMPCVFPILALKALHLSRAGGEDGHARGDALAYAAGAIVGTGALGGILLAIRAAGTQAGWAFQLQDPRTIMLLLLLAVAITANLLGLFDLPVVGGRLRPAGGFSTGVLAAFVATPCAGPFLGAALGTALLLPAAGALQVFGALGLGLALPFVIVAFVPKLRRMLPKPGAWMQRLQRLLAIPMAASAAGAAWLLWRLGGSTALIAAAAWSVLLLALLIGFGFAQRRGRSLGIAVTAFATMFTILAVATVPKAVGHASNAASAAGAWSEAKVAQYQQQHQPVFVYFTADWCLTCKVNEAAAIDRAETRDAFKVAGVKVLAGDWTDGDPAITRFLDSRGRAGVPFYLWYAPGQQAEELPQVLTPAMLISRARALKR